MLKVIYNNSELLSYKEEDYLKIIENKNNLICPHCQEKVLFIDALQKIKHFRHYVERNCEFEPETERHIEMKLFLKQIFPDFILEENLKFAIPDLYNREKKIAIEVQHSKLSLSKFLERTENYRLNNIYVLWIFDTELLKENVSDFLRKAHEIYFGRIYIYKDRNIFPVHFEKIERLVKINTDFSNIEPEFSDEECNSYISKIYKIKRKFLFGDYINHFFLILCQNNWKEKYFIAKFSDKKFW